MVTTLFFHMVLRKFMENTNNKPSFSQYNIFHKYKYLFFQSVYLFNSVVSRLFFRVLLCTHYGPMQCFSTYFHKSTEIGVLQPIFPAYAISCDYGSITH